MGEGQTKLWEMSIFKGLLWKRSQRRKETENEHLES